MIRLEQLKAEERAQIADSPWRRSDVRRRAANPRGHSRLKPIAYGLMKALSKVAKDAMELCPKERRTLARILLELSEEDIEFSEGVEAAWEEEICRRMESVKAGISTGRSYEEVFADLDRRFPS